MVITALPCGGDTPSTGHSASRARYWPEAMSVVPSYTGSLRTGGARTEPAPRVTARESAKRSAPWRREEEDDVMNSVSRRRFLLTSATVLGSSLVPPVARRAAAAEQDLVPRKLPFPPNDEFGN